MLEIFEMINVRHICYRWSSEINQIRCEPTKIQSIVHDSFTRVVCDMTHISIDVVCDRIDFRTIQSFFSIFSSSHLGKY
jgi:hypothetical protein